MNGQSLTPDERRALGIAALTVAVTTLVSGLVSWGVEAVKHRVTKAPETRDPPPAGGADGAPGA